MTSAASRPFPTDFLWGVATAGHQNEGGNTTSDTWFLENVTPTIFAERSGAARLVGRIPRRNHRERQRRARRITRNSERTRTRRGDRL